MIKAAAEAYLTVNMSRFSNLEFGGHQEDESGRREELRDETYFVAQAETAFTQGEFEPALRAWSKVLEHNPKYAGAWTGQVRMLIELGEYREARLWADKALEQFPNEAELLAAKAVALARAGDLDAALVFSDNAIEERGNTPYIWLARGDVLLARQEKRAEYSFEKAVRLAPGNWVPLWLTARAYFFYHRIVLAMQHAQQGLALDAGRGMLWLQAGQCQLALGLVTPARLSLEQAQQLLPRSPLVAAVCREVAQTGLGARLRGRLRGMFGS